MNDVIICAAALLGCLVGGLWLPQLVWYFGLPRIIRRNLPPRARPWWLP